MVNFMLEENIFFYMFKGPKLDTALFKYHILEAYIVITITFAFLIILFGVLCRLEHSVFLKDKNQVGIICLEWA